MFWHWKSRTRKSKKFKHQQECVHFFWWNNIFKWLPKRVHQRHPRICRRTESLKIMETPLGCSLHLSSTPFDRTTSLLDLWLPTRFLLPLTLLLGSIDRSGRLTLVRNLAYLFLLDRSRWVRGRFRGTIGRGRYPSSIFTAPRPWGVGCACTRRIVGEYRVVDRERFDRYCGLCWLFWIDSIDLRPNGFVFLAILSSFIGLSPSRYEVVKLYTRKRIIFMIAKKKARWQNISPFQLLFLGITSELMKINDVVDWFRETYHRTTLPAVRRFLSP